MNISKLNDTFLTGVLETNVNVSCYGRYTEVRRAVGCRLNSKVETLVSRCRVDSCLLIL